MKTRGMKCCSETLKPQAGQNIGLWRALALAGGLSLGLAASAGVTTNVWVNATDAEADISGSSANWKGGAVPAGAKATAGGGTVGLNEVFDFSKPLEGIGMQRIATAGNVYPEIGYAVGGKDRQILANGYANRYFRIRDWSAFLGRYVTQVFGRGLFAQPSAAENLTAKLNDAHSRRDGHFNVMTDASTLEIGTLSGLGYLSFNKDANSKIDSTIAVGDFPVNEATRLSVGRGKKVSLPGVTVPDELPGDPYLVLDAAVESSIVPTTGSDGKDYVGRWNDARGGEGRPYATSVDAEKMPWQGTDANGRKVVDFGISICDFIQGNVGFQTDQFTNGVSIGYSGYGGVTLGRTAWMSLSETVSNVREAFFVVRDREAFSGWGQWLGSPSGGTQDFQRYQARAGFNDFMTDSVSGLFKGVTTAVKLGDARLDGARVDYDYEMSLADDLHVISLGLEGTGTADRIGSNGKTVVKLNAAGYERGFAVGGFTLAEMVLYTNALTVAQRTQVNAYLKRKWLSGARAGNYTLDELAFANNYQNAELPTAPEPELEVAGGELRTRRLAVNGKRTGFVKSGEGTLAVEQITSGLRVNVKGGALKFAKTELNTKKPVPTAPAPGSSIWLDAENIDSMVVSNAVDGSDRVFVKKWNHAANGGLNNLNAPASAGFAAATGWDAGSLDKSYRYPTRVTSEKLGGKHVIDFGPLKKLGRTGDEYSKYGAYGDPADGCSAFRIVQQRRASTTTGAICVRDGFIVVRAKHLGANIISDGNTNIYRYQDTINGNLFDPSQSVPVFGDYWAINAVAFRPSIVITDDEFRLFSYRLTNPNSTFNGLGIARDGDSWLGGQDVAEVIQYDRRLSDEEFRDTEAYLLKKWFNKTHPSYTDSEGGADVASIDYDEGVAPKLTAEVPVTVGAVKTTGTALQVSGEGSVSVASVAKTVRDFAVDGGSLETEQDWLSDAALHLDASREDTIVYREGQEADRRISRWLDCRHNGWYASCSLTDSKGNAYTNATYETAADAASELLEGSRYVDFGDSDARAEQAGMYFYKPGAYDKYGNFVTQTLNVREWHIVYCLTRSGNYPPLGGSLGIEVHGLVPSGNNSSMFWSSCTAAKEAAKRVDGSDWYSNNNYQPSGRALSATKFYVQSIAAADYAAASSLAIDRQSTRGNVKICEVILFTGKTNTTERAEAIHAYLQKKWKGVGEGVVGAPVGSVALANGGKLTLDNDVTLGSDSRISASVTATGVSAFTVGGTLTVGAGATLTVTVDDKMARAKGEWTVLSAGTIVNPENLSIRIVGPDRATSRTKAVWENGKLVLKMMPAGMVLLVR